MRGEHTARSARPDTVDVMPALSDSAAKHLRKIKRRPDLPEWWTLFQIVCGVLVVAAILFGFIAQIGADDNAGPELPPVGTVDVGTVPDTEPTVTEPDDNPTTTEVPATTEAPEPADVTVELPYISGSTVQVPAAALERAEAVVRAAYGDTAVLSDASVGFQNVDRIAFTMNVDVDGDGPAAAEQVSVVTVLAGETWTGTL